MNKKYKTIIDDMVREYKEEPNKQMSKLYFIVAQYLDEESDEEINERLKQVKK